MVFWNQSGVIQRKDPGLAREVQPAKIFVSVSADTIVFQSPPWLQARGGVDRKSLNPLWTQFESGLPLNSSDGGQSLINGTGVDLGPSRSGGCGLPPASRMAMASRIGYHSNKKTALMKIYDDICHSLGLYILHF